MITTKPRKKINVALVSPEYPPLTNWGGLATFNKNLAHLLKDMKFNIHVITYDGVGEVRKDLIKDKINIHYIRLRFASKLINFIYFIFPFGLIRNLFVKRLPDLVFAIEWNMFSYIYFRSISKRITFDVVHSSTYYAPALLIKLFNKNLSSVVHIQGQLDLLKKYEKKDINAKVQVFIENEYIKRFSDQIVVCSKNIYRTITNKSDYLKKKTVFIPNFIYLNSYPKFRYKKINKNTFIFYGRLEYRKGVDLLIEAFIKLYRQNKRIKLVIIGDKKGSFKSEHGFLSFDQYYSALPNPDNVKDKISFISKINNTKKLLNNLRRLNGIVIIPSRFEPFGFAIIEPMALGLPVIASNFGGGLEIIKDGKNGYLFKPNKNSVYSLLNRMVKTKDIQLMKIILDARKTVLKSYTPESVKVKYINLYRYISG